MLLGLCGCPQQPVVQLQSARIVGASQYGVNMMMRLRVSNRNPFDVRVRNVRAQVVVAERYMLPYLRFNPDQWMPANSWSYVDVPATIPLNLVTPLLATTLRSNVITYHASGLVDVTATRLLGLQINDYELNDDGAMSRADLAMIAARTVLPSGNAPPPPRAGVLLIPMPR